MASTFFAVFNAETNSSPEELGKKAGKEGKTLDYVKSAKFVKLEAESVADAQAAVKTLFGSDSTPVVVTEAQWKES